MFANYLKVTLRNIKRQKFFSLINIMGLALGMACCLLIFMFVQHELSYDKFHQNADRIFRVVFCTSEDNTPTNANGSFGVGPALKREFAEVFDCVRIRKMGQGVKRFIGYKDKKYYEEKFFFASPSIFSVFDFPLVRGNPETVLKEPNTIVLTEEMAAKYFPGEDPLGKTLQADPYNDGQMMIFRVTGIAKNVPDNSHFHFDFLASYVSQRDNLDNFSGFWQHYSYVLLEDKASKASLTPQLDAFLERNWRQDPWYRIRLQPLSDIRLHSHLRSEIEPTGNISYVYIFSIIALFVLVVAQVNFMSLATARSSQRAKEVGLRKVVGAQKRQLIKQFLGESIILCFLSSLVSMILIIVALPLFNRLADKNLTLHFFFESLCYPGNNFGHCVCWPYFRILSCPVSVGV